MKAYPFLCLLMTVSLQSSLRAVDSVWPGWLGPDRNGRVQGFEPPAQWPAELKPNWSVKVGSGYGTAVVAAGKVMIHSRQGRRRWFGPSILFQARFFGPRATRSRSKWAVAGSAMARAPRPILPIPTGVFSPRAYPVFSRLGRRIRASCFGGRSRESVLGNRMPIGGDQFPSDPRGPDH